MSNGIARLTDTGSGYCSSHRRNVTGVITTCSSSVVTDGGLGIATTGDIVTASCGHTGVIQGTLNNIMTNNKATAKIGDSFTGIFTGTITTGSNTVTTS